MYLPWFWRLATLFDISAGIQAASRFPGCGSSTASDGVEWTSYRSASQAAAAITPRSPGRGVGHVSTRYKPGYIASASPRSLSKNRNGPAGIVNVSLTYRDHVQSPDTTPAGKAEFIIIREPAGSLRPAELIITLVPYVRGHT